METYRRLEDLVVYQRLCCLHIEIGGLTHRWPNGTMQEDGETYGFPENPNPETLNPIPLDAPCSHPS